MRRSNTSKIGLAVAASIAAIGLFTAVRRPSTVHRLPSAVSFNFHVRPILSDRCFKCHGPDPAHREGGLRLDTEAGAKAPLGDAQDHFAIVPGDAARSTLVQRIFSTNPDSLMPTPESHLTLSDFEKQILKRWIEQGAKWEPHWAFVAPQKPPVPTVKNADWARNEIDFFILEKQQANGLEPSEPAEKERLARRVSFDLTGLPPSPAQLAQFLQNPAPDAYEQLVDTLLAAPAYGERWAAYWLDLARYSDTHGYQDDLARTMWPWRDWVIRAFNQNLPYDKFVTEQLAGDLLPNATLENLLASAFNRNHKITQEGGVIDEEYRQEYVADRTTTFSKAFLGLTLECARCHDHKYDPLTTREFYEMNAFFNKVPETGFVPNLATPAPFVKITAREWHEKLPFLNAKAVLKAEKDSILQMVMRDSVGLRATRLLRRGQYDQPADTVAENTPAAVLPFSAGNFPKNRLGLAQWLFDPRNPLTARVMVNRLWQEVFGRGIVATSDNFGVQGALPTHPELLDWLATDFRDHGWDMKRTLRLLVTSATYRQSSATNPDLQSQDPENQWLARGPRHRLPFEMLRDQALAAADLLVPEIGGPSVKPYQPPGLWEEIAADKTGNDFRGENTYKVDTLLANLWRRSLYTYNRRTIPPPAMLAFDVAPRDVCEVRRPRTSTPLQALNQLNDEQMLEASRVLACNVLKNKDLGTNAQARVEAVFRKILCRKPTRQESKLLADLYASELARFQRDPERAKKLLKIGRYPQDESLDCSDCAALMLVASTVFNLDEAVSKT